MLAITISQPWAFLVATGAKPIENRRWRTDYRGDLLIHAGRGTQYRSIFNSLRRKYADHNIPTWEAIDKGCAIAVVTMYDCLDMETLWRCAPLIGDVGPLRDFAQGPWCHLYRDVRPLREPIPWPGLQRLWPVPASLESRVRASLGGDES